LNVVPAAVLAEVRTHVEREAGAAAELRAVHPVGGGCISPCARVRIGEESFFLKWAGKADPPAAFFVEEARSLEALRERAAVRVPRVRGVTEQWLLLEWLEPGAPTRDGWAALGRSLAAVHAPQGESFGWPAANYIGTLPQDNGRSDTWGAFWRERRLAPQLERAYAAGFFAAPERRRFERLLVRMESLLAAGDAEGASLLHGDLWSGNIHFTESGTAALIDPSSYRGHREVDLAMAELFGGFAADFFDAYAEAFPLRAGYVELRRPLYQLYYQLVHVNLFGRGYVAGTLGLLEAAEAAA
jgi:fructosamine-3-kinase